MDSDGILYLCEDAAEEETLIKAGIKRAKGIIAALATDIDNVYLILTARQLNPSFETIIHPGDTVIAVGEEKNLKKLETKLNL